MMIECTSVVAWSKEFLLKVQIFVLVTSTFFHWKASPKPALVLITKTKQPSVLKFSLLKKCVGNIKGTGPIYISRGQCE